MLNHLIITNFALVDRLELELPPGMTVITGETGAGKSIMLDALGLALGDRADTGMIGPADTRAEVIASFDVSDNPEAAAWLTERNLVTEDDECILRRTTSTDGRSRAFINGVPSTVGDLRALGGSLIDIHSQHEHHSLLKKQVQRQLLDEFAGTETLVNQIHELALSHRSISHHLAELVQQNESENARLQLLNYQVQELSELAIQPGEYAQLEVEQHRLANAETLIATCNVVMTLCREAEEGNALDVLRHSLQLLADLGQGELSSVAGLLESAAIQLEEATHDLERFRDGVDINPGRLSEVESRLGAMFDLGRKHRVEPAELPQLLDNLAAELEALTGIDEAIDNLQQQRSAVEQNYGKLARKLSKARSKAAGKLQSLVNAQLASLEMSGADFTVQLNPLQGKVQPTGLEDVEFLITTNPGQAPRPLNKVASGGELSRISLAIQVVTAGTSRIPSLVFDEVDVGIGGAVAEIVGALIRQLGSQTQVICVTHLPQVAAQGHQHLKVVKKSSGEAVRSIVESLSDARKVEEIARMLGGVELTEQSLAHAREMFQAAQS